MKEKPTRNICIEETTENFNSSNCDKEPISQFRTVTVTNNYFGGPPIDDNDIKQSHEPLNVTLAKILPAVVDVSSL